MGFFSFSLCYNLFYIFNRTFYIFNRIYLCPECSDIVSKWVILLLYRSKYNLVWNNFLEDWSWSWKKKTLDRWWVNHLWTVLVEGLCNISCPFVLFQTKSKGVNKVLILAQIIFIAWYYIPIYYLLMGTKIVCLGEKETQ